MIWKGLSMTVIYVSPRCNCQTMLHRSSWSRDIHRSNTSPGLTLHSMLPYLCYFSYDKISGWISCRSIQSKPADNAFRPAAVHGGISVNRARYPADRLGRLRRHRLIRCCIVIALFDRYRIVRQRYLTYTFLLSGGNVYVIRLPS